MESKKEYMQNWRKNNPNYQKEWIANNEKYQKPSRKARPTICSWDNCNSDRVYKTSISCKEHNYLYSLSRKFGISKDEVLMLKDKKCCDICEESFDDKKMHIDHCHINGNVRGTLCMNCNVLLGHAFDNIDILTKAITYLYKNERKT